MIDKEKLQKQMERAKKTFAAFAKDETVWKQTLANALLELLSEQPSITAVDLRQRLTDRMGAPIRIQGTDMSIDFSKDASEAAIAHLDNAVSKLRQDSQ